MVMAFAKPQTAVMLRETRRHGSQDYPFAFYQIRSDQLHGSPVFQVKHHWHEETEILYFRKGCFQLEINMQKYKVDEECFCFIGSGELHHIYAEKPFDEQALVFALPSLSFAEHDPAQIQILAPLLDGELSFPTLVRSTDACFDTIRKAFTEISAAFPGTADSRHFQDQYTLSGTAQYLRVKAYLYAIFAALIENGLLSDASGAGTDHRILAIKKALSYMKEHCREKLYIRDIAAEVGMNEQYFCRFFKKAIGRSPIEYLTELRIRRACRLLRDTDLPVMEICLDCGFNNLGNFIRAFRRQCGCTPGRFRKSTP